MNVREYREYRRITKIGKKKFRAVCRHRTVKDGYCLRCLRRVGDRL